MSAPLDHTNEALHFTLALAPHQVQDYKIRIDQYPSTFVAQVVDPDGCTLDWTRATAANEMEAAKHAWSWFRQTITRTIRTESGTPKTSYMSAEDIVEFI